MQILCIAVLVASSGVFIIRQAPIAGGPLGLPTGYLICGGNKPGPDLVVGFGVENDGSVPVTLGRATFEKVQGMTVRGVWLYRQHGRTGIGALPWPIKHYHYWDQRTSLLGQVLTPGEQEEIVVRIHRTATSGVARLGDVSYSAYGLQFRQHSGSIMGFRSKTNNLCHW